MEAASLARRTRRHQVPDRAQVRRGRWWSFSTRAHLTLAAATSRSSRNAQTTGIKIQGSTHHPPLSPLPTTEPRDGSIKEHERGDWMRWSMLRKRASVCGLVVVAPWPWGTRRIPLLQPKSRPPQTMTSLDGSSTEEGAQDSRSLSVMYAVLAKNPQNLSWLNGASKFDSCRWKPSRDVA